ncbi:rhodanese-like domain-containing protein [Maricaulis sp. MIT060901]|uniref:rhodanese-like domain-containing protein n=1 Tax=Maricaulis sp. MIT060901 TaxID=3096993 RepID=UPI00399B9504
MEKTVNWSVGAVAMALAAGEIILVDVREPQEFHAERIPGAMLCPLSDFNPRTLPHSGKKKTVLHCKSGGRSGRALRMCQEAGVEVAGHLEGGILKWIAEGKETRSDLEEKKGMSVPQSVMALGSLMVLVSMGLSLAFGPIWLLLGGAVSFMLLQAAFTGFCPAARFFLALGFRPA